MAAIVPTNVLAEDAVRYDSPTALPAAGQRLRNQRLRTTSYFFQDVLNLQDWASPRGVVACAWQANTTADNVAWGVQTTGNLTSLRLTTGVATPDGWLHVMTGGNLQLTETNDLVPFTLNHPGTIGYVSQGSIFVNHRSAVPNTLTNGKVMRTGFSGVRRQFFPFTTGSTSDTWAAQTGGLCRGIVSVAWQAATITSGDATAVTLDANGDVVFTGVSGASGTLWIWRRS